LSSRDAAYRNPIRIEYVDWLDPRAVALREAMDAETSAMYAEFSLSQSREVQAAIDDALTVDPATIVTTIIAVDGDEPVGHSALRPVHLDTLDDRVALDDRALDDRVLEVKKVFVAESVRGRGVARLLMGELETVARGRGAASLVLQTGPLQVPAITLYENLGYVAIPPYGKYDAIPGALCYEKVL
jgi:GNAT superfamily N-acetyltransferase